MKVSFDAELHTTYYDCTVWRIEDGKKTNITHHKNTLTYKWTLTTGCLPLAVGPVNASASWYHEGCSAADEAASTIKIEVTYKEQNVNKTLSYTGGARADEGKTVDLKP